MRILMTADTVGGVWTYALDLCRALQTYNVEVILATMGAPTTDDQRLAVSACRNIRLVESQYKLEWMPDPWTDIRDAGEWLLSLRDLYRPDLVHLNGYCHGALDWSVPSIIVAHSCVWSWWQAVRGESAPPDWIEYRHQVTAGLADASMVIAPTAALLHEVRRLYGPFAADRVIHNGRDPSLYRREAKQPFVLSAGRLWDEAKNIHLLEEAADDVVWPIRLAGDANHPSGAGAVHSTLKLLGKLTPGELAETYARAAIYAAPALYEPFGLAPLEAALSGCALVLSDIPTLREVWGEAAMYADPRSAASFAEQINWLASDELLRKGMAQLAHQHAHTYSARKMGERYYRTYRELTGGFQPPYEATFSADHLHT